jgi:hypothetical protein
LLPFRCPKTRRLVATAIKTDPASLARAWTDRIRITCALCGGSHTFDVRDAYISAVISNELMRGLP